MAAVGVTIGPWPSARIRLESRQLRGHHRHVSELAPGFLIATPQLDDGFKQALVLLLEHSSDGALGLVVNKPGRLTLGEVATSQNMPLIPSQKQSPVFVGGPVQPERGFVIHTREDLPESVQLLPGLWVSSSLESLKLLLSENAGGWRLCLGYAGWGPGQLEKELQEGSWLSTPATQSDVLGLAPADAWDLVLRGMGIEPHMLMHATGLH